MKPVHIGCSGWNYAHWRGLVYPKGVPQRRWLEHYATSFDTVEVNATFYRLPKREMVAGWVERTPDDFILTLKASRYLTHIKRLTRSRAASSCSRERIEPLLASSEDGAAALAAAGELSPRRRAARVGARGAAGRGATRSSSATRAGSPTR